MAVTAVVLAGGEPDAVAAREPGAANKAFVRVAGTTLVERTLRSLAADTRIGRIIVVTPRSARDHPALELADERRDDGPRMAQSLRSGLLGLPPGEAVLVCASDLPVLSTAAIDEFLDLSAQRDADITYSCVERSVHERRFADFPHTWAKLKEGEFCGGGAITIKPRALDALDGLLDRLGRARKNPLALAGVFGLDIMTNYVLGRLSVEHAERRAAELLGAPAAAAICSHPEIAINVDRPEDIERAETALRGM